MNKLSPYEVLFKKQPDFTFFLRSFGCLCYVSTHVKDRNKFTPRATPNVFLGYATCYKGYKVLDLESNVVSVSRNVIFHENTFPFMNVPSSEPKHDLFSSSVLPMPIPVALDSNDLVHSSSIPAPALHPSLSPQTDQSTSAPSSQETVASDVG